MNLKVTFLFPVLILIGCASEPSSDTKVPVPISDTVVISGINNDAKDNDAEIEKGLELMTKSDCFSCHKLDETLIGPAYSAVATKYKEIKRGEAVDSISSQIIEGGVGKWGQIPMMPHANITKDESNAMAAYILSIKSN